MQRALCALFAASPQAARSLHNADLRSPDYGGAPLDASAPHAMYRAMLQHNSARAGKHAHLAHAAVVGLHALCCGLPALAMIAAAVSGATSGIALLAGAFAPIHAFLHAHEIWILGLSASLVVVGGGLEVWSRRERHSHGFPWLFALSVGCFLLNAAIIAVHRAL